MYLISVLEESHVYIEESHVYIEVSHVYIEVSTFISKLNVMA